MISRYKTMPEYALRRLKNSREKLLTKSRLVYAIERIFRMLQRCSPASKFRDPRAIDIYMLGWAVAGLVAVSIACLTWPTIPFYNICILRIVAFLRIADIVQAVGNVGIFDQLSAPENAEGNKVQQVENIIRSLILFLINFIELIFWFGLLYLSMHLKAAESLHWYDAFYFSLITQLTIGYGDVQPLGAAKIIAGVQGIVGWALTLLVLGRFVSAMQGIGEKGA
jgi:hypothetical protein